MKINTSNIERILATQKMSRSELAIRSGISRQSISTILGRGTCSAINVGRIAETLGVDVTEIMKGEAK